MNDEKKTGKPQKLGFERNKNFVPEEQLTDTPSRLLRKIFKALNMNQSTWSSLMNEYLRWIHPDNSGTPAEVKKARSTTLGNTQSAYFMSKTLSFNKLIAAMKILKFRNVTFTISGETASGEKVTVSETTFLRKDLPTPEDDDE